MKKILLIISLMLCFGLCFGSLHDAGDSYYTCVGDWWDGTCTCNFCGLDITTTFPKRHCCAGMENWASAQWGGDCHCVEAYGRDMFECTDASAGSGSANLMNDAMGQAFFFRDQALETADWTSNNSQKWEAFKARALEQGYANIQDFLRANPGTMTYNDYAMWKQISYLDNSYFGGATGDKRLVRPGGKGPTADFYVNIPDDKNKGTSANYNAKSNSQPGRGNEPLPELPEGNTWVNSGGVYIGDGDTPALLRNQEDDGQPLTQEQMEMESINATKDGTREVLESWDELKEWYNAKRPEASEFGKAAYDFIAGEVGDKLINILEARGMASAGMSASVGAGVAGAQFGLVAADVITGKADAVDMVVAGAELRISFIPGVGKFAPLLLKGGGYVGSKIYCAWSGKTDEQLRQTMRSMDGVGYGVGFTMQAVYRLVGGKK